MAIGDKVVQLCIQCISIAVMVVIIMPSFVAPYFGITPEQYQSNEILFTILAALIGSVVGWIGAKLVGGSIRRGV